MREYSSYGLAECNNTRPTNYNYTLDEHLEQSWLVGNGWTTIHRVRVTLQVWEKRGSMQSPTYLVLLVPHIGHFQQITHIQYEHTRERRWDGGTFACIMTPSYAAKGFGFADSDVIKITRFKGSWLCVVWWEVFSGRLRCWWRGYSTLWRWTETAHCRKIFRDATQIFLRGTRWVRDNHSGGGDGAGGLLKWWCWRGWRVCAGIMRLRRLFHDFSLAILIFDYTTALPAICGFHSADLYYSLIGRYEFVRLDDILFANMCNRLCAVRRRRLSYTYSTCCSLSLETYESF